MSADHLVHLEAALAGLAPELRGCIYAMADPGAAERMRRLRARRARGARIVAVEVGDELRDVLVDRGLLGEDDESHEALEFAMRMLIEDLAEAHVHESVTRNGRPSEG